MRKLIQISFLLQVEKNFILKVWRKSPTLESSKLIPTPLQDAVVGFTAVNIKNLVRGGAPSISSWFNIVDFNGRCNGQLRVHISLLPSSSSRVPPETVTSASVEDDDEFDSSLSRALKRKFTELEGISQRLKARLFDITSEDDDFDPDDEFERDLNTIAVEEGETAIGAETDTENFAWLGDSQNIFAPADRCASGCSTSHQNPTNYVQESVELFKSLLDAVPSTSTSDESRIAHISKALHKTSMSSEDEERPNPEGEGKE